MMATETPEMLNATSGFADSTGLAGPVIVVMYIVAVVAISGVIAPWAARSELLTRVGGGVVQSLEYAIKGLAASAAALAFGYPVYWVATAEGDTQGLALTVIAGLVGIYLALVVIGWIADKAVQRFIDAHPDYEEWGDLFPEADDEEGGEPA